MLLNEIVRYRVVAHKYAHKLVKLLITELKSFFFRGLDHTGELFEANEALMEEDASKDVVTETVPYENWAMLVPKMIKDFIQVFVRMHFAAIVLPFFDEFFAILWIDCLNRFVCAVHD